MDWSSDSGESSEWDVPPPPDMHPNVAQYSYKPSYTEHSTQLSEVGIDPDLFVSEIDDDFKCSICCQIVEHPLECAMCESLFCEPHIRESLKLRSRCPRCNQTLRLTNLRKPSRIIRNALGKFRLRCPNSDTGCEDVISVDDMQRHVMLECGYVKVHCRYEDCPKSEEQGDTVFRKDLEEHMQLCTYRPVECSLNCGEVIPFWYQADHCSDECLMYMSECRCGAMVARKDEDPHQAECPKAIICCPMAGCDEELTRELLENHLQTSYLKHLTCLSQVVSSQAQQIQSLNEQVASLEKYKFCSVLQTHNSVTFPVTGINGMIANAKAGRRAKCRSPRYTLGNGLNFELEVGFDMTFASVYLSLQPGPYDGLLSWPFRHGYRLAILDQSAYPQHISRLVNTQRHPDSQVFRRKRNETQRGHGFAKFAQIKKLQTRQYIADDVMYVKLIVDDLESDDDDDDDRSR